MGLWAKPSHSSAAVAAKGHQFGRMMRVVVDTSTVPRWDSSCASTRSREVLPPLPITAVRPGRIPSSSHNSMPVTTFHTHCTTEISRRKPLDKGCLWC